MYKIAGDARTTGVKPATNQPGHLIGIWLSQDSHDSTSIQESPTEMPRRPVLGKSAQETDVYTKIGGGVVVDAACACSARIIRPVE